MLLEINIGVYRDHNIHSSEQIHSQYLAKTPRRVHTAISIYFPMQTTENHRHFSISDVTRTIFPELFSVQALHKYQSLQVLEKCLYNIDTKLLN